MFHFKLLELESELLAKELAGKEALLTPECEQLLQFIELEVGLKLGDRAPKDWRGWISYRRQKNSLVILRGRSFLEAGMFLKDYRGGLDVAYGLDTVTEYKRGFDITPPQELDHVLINFRLLDPPHIMVWYGENIAPYQLFFEAEASYQSEERLKDAIVEGCAWILTKPKELTLSEFLQKHGDKSE
jgi:hypothetical protein